MSESAPRPRRILVSIAAREAFAPMCQVLLGRLGYAILDPDAFAADYGADERPDAMLVDERRLAEIEDDGGPPIPIVALVGSQGVYGMDGRVQGAVPRPAGLHELYRVLQEVLEETPRSTPRLPTHLAVRCFAPAQGHWRATLVVLSENGCLLRSSESLLLGSKIGISFELPGDGAFELEAEVAYQLPPDVGLVFSSCASTTRAAIQRFLIRLLAR